MVKILKIKSNTKTVEDVFVIEKSLFGKSGYSKQTIKENLENSLYCNFGAYFNQELIGYVSAYYFDNEATILKIAVKKEYQRLGNGLKLFRKVYSYLLKINVKKIFLEVNENNITAINFYEKLNFEKFNVRNNYYSDGSNAIEMMCVLK